MIETGTNEPAIVTHNIPRIEVYQVTGDELDRVEDACSKVGHDFSFMLTAISVGVTSFVALIAGTFSPRGELSIRAIIGICFVVAIYTGSRWYRSRTNGLDVVRNIRSRKVDPKS